MNGLNSFQKMNELFLNFGCLTQQLVEFLTSIIFLYYLNQHSFDNAEIQYLSQLLSLSNHQINSNQLLIQFISYTSGMISPFDDHCKDTVTDF